MDLQRMMCAPKGTHLKAWLSGHCFGVFFSVLEFELGGQILIRTSLGPLMKVARSIFPPLLDAPPHRRLSGLRNRKPPPPPIKPCFQLKAWVFSPFRWGLSGFQMLHVCMSTWHPFVQCIGRPLVHVCFDSIAQKTLFHEDW